MPRVRDWRSGVGFPYNAGGASSAPQSKNLKFGGHLAHLARSLHLQLTIANRHRVGKNVRGISLGLLASAILVIGAPAAQAGITCQWIPAMCPAQGNPGSGGGNSVPEPGTLGLLALGAAATIGMRFRKKKP